MVISCGFGFEQKFWRMDGFGEKKARIGGFAYPYSPPSILKSLANERKKIMLSGPFYRAESCEHGMLLVDVT